jgi:hypothetical protein
MPLNEDEVSKIKKFCNDYTELEGGCFDPAIIIPEMEALFELAGSRTDLCLQGGAVPIVFGGFNRVYVYPNGNVKVSRSHCSSKFLSTARDLGYEII